MSTAIFAGIGSQRRQIILGGQLGEGAAGKVYRVEASEDRAAKLFHPDRNGPMLERKIHMMLGNAPALPGLQRGDHRHPQIAWPDEPLNDATGRFRGFLMPLIDFDRSTSLVNLLQRSSRRSERLPEYYGYRVLVARNLAALFASLHQAGHFMIDLKPANLRVYRETSWLAVVDVDGFSVAGANGDRIAADQVSDEYVAPESYGRHVGLLGEEQDRFALAIILFQLLNNGLHPFAGTASKPGQPSDNQGRIVAGLYPYGRTPAADTRPSATSIHDCFPSNTRALFDRAFIGSAVRPSAAEWRAELDGLVATMTPCPVKPDQHGRFGERCGFCEREARTAALAEAGRRRDRERARLRQQQQKQREAVPATPAAVGNARRPRRALAPHPVQRMRTPTLTPTHARRIAGTAVAAIGVASLLFVGMSGIAEKLPAWRRAVFGPAIVPAAFDQPAGDVRDRCEISDDGRPTQGCTDFAVVEKADEFRVLLKSIMAGASALERSHLQGILSGFDNERRQCRQDAIPTLCLAVRLDRQNAFLQNWLRAGRKTATTRFVPIA
jgi:DNA-binding helix-hairpin-helix protein with protein kinase domain